MSELLGRLADVLQTRLDSPWIWLIVFLVAGLDALVPLMPSETTVVMMAVLIGPELPRLALLAAVAAAGALSGDCLSFGVGRWLGPRAVTRLMRGEHGRRRYAWARSMVERHAAALVIAARFLPGGRVASGLCTGSMGFPFRRFAALDTAGAVLWAASSTAIGLIGGASFGDEPVKGLGLAFGLALSAVAGVDAVRRWRRPRGRHVTAP
ncbi:DedA family protein [Streptomyces sp. NPDC058257]|uniref:DedA family protein n=1 Tax=Streptomyces sp. NPDC058257 TaxID=3346409 RepID=UPI0036E3E46F